MKLNFKMAFVLCAVLGHRAQTDAEGGSTNWLQVSTDGFGGNDCDRAGNIVVTGGNSGQTLFKFNHDGQLLWSIKEPNPDFGYGYVAVAKDSGTFYAVGGDFREFWGAIVVNAPLYLLDGPLAVGFRFGTAMIIMLYQII